MPRRERRVEILDDPGTPWSLRRRSHRDIRVANRLFGGNRALRIGLRDALSPLRGHDVSLLDVGCGIGTSLEVASLLSAALGIRLQAIGLDLSEPLARAYAVNAGEGVCGTALALPLGDESVDVVLCSLLIHHFEDEALLQLLREANRVARRAVVIHELRRSRLAAAGLWAASFPLAFHPVSRHDGVASVMRGFTRDELGALVHRATGTTPRVTERAGFRLVATWTRAHDEAPRPALDPLGFPA